MDQYINREKILKEELKMGYFKDMLNTDSNPQEYLPEMNERFDDKADPTKMKTFFDSFLQNCDSREASRIYHHALKEHGFVLYGGRKDRALLVNFDYKNGAVRLIKGDDVNEEKEFPLEKFFNLSALSKLKCCSRGSVYEILSGALRSEFKGKVFVGGQFGYDDPTSCGDFDTDKAKSGKVFTIVLASDNSDPLEVEDGYVLDTHQTGYCKTHILLPYSVIC